MAREKFRVLAVNETACWADEILARYAIKAAFGLYLIRDGEATHCCSLTPSSWGDAIENTFVFRDDLPNDDPLRDEAHDDLSHEGLESAYFPFVGPNFDRRFVGDAFVVSVDAREHGGLKSDAYHTAIWEAAREDLCNGVDYPAITDDAVFRQWPGARAVAA